MEWLTRILSLPKGLELAERLVRAEEQKAQALTRLAELAELHLGVDPLSLAKDAEPLQPPTLVEYEVEDEGFFAELRTIGAELRTKTGKVPDEETVLKEYDQRRLVDQREP